MSFKSIRKKYIIIPKAFVATLNTDCRGGKEKDDRLEGTWNIFNFFITTKMLV